MTASYSIVVLGVIALSLSLVILLVSWVQTQGIQKHSEVLKSVAGVPVSSSQYYTLAVTYFEQVQPVRLTKGYTLPILALFLTVLGGGVVSYFGAQWTQYLSTENYILGGPLAKSANESVEAYQSITVLVGTWAFIGAYLYVIIDLINRVNNNDIAPITYYYYTIRILTACLVAGLVRHGLALFGSDLLKESTMLVPIGFAVGWEPDLWLKTLIAKLAAKLGLLGDQKSPDPASLPSSLSLLLVEGLTQEKRERMEELSIDNCEALANHNPFILWARTAYQLLHIIDWIAQAQLLLLVKEDDMRKLRTNGIRDIFAFETALGGQSAAQVANILNYPPQVCTDILTYLRSSPKFNRLKDVYSRM